jgi:hypothetical protein
MDVLRLAVGLLLLYVAADLASPLIPGAFALDPDESVEASRLERTVQALPIAVAGSGPSSLAPAPPRPCLRIARSSAGPLPARHRDWLPRARPGAPAAASPRPEDLPA